MSGSEYPKKYWWLVLVVVPIAAAIISRLDIRFSSPSEVSVMNKEESVSTRNIDSIDAVGLWEVNATTYTATLEIYNTDEGIKGRLKVNGYSNWEALTELKINGRAISFTRPVSVRQDFKGFIDNDVIRGEILAGGAVFGWNADKVSQDQ